MREYTLPLCCKLFDVVTTLWFPQGHVGASRASIAVGKKMSFLCKKTNGGA